MYRICSTLIVSIAVYSGIINAAHTAEEIRKKRAAKLTAKTSQNQPKPSDDDQELAQALAASAREAEEQRALEQALAESKKPTTTSAPQPLPSSNGETEDLELAKALSLSEQEEKQQFAAASSAQPLAPVIAMQSSPTILERYVPVQEQQGLTCGYHALWNCSIVLRWLQKEISLEQRDKDLQNFASDHLGTMKSMVKTLGTNNDPKLENISDGEMKYLAKNYLKLPARTCTIISNITEYNPSIHASLELLAALRALLINPELSYHAFILNSGRHEKGKPGEASACGVGGHWVAVAVAKQGTALTLYAMDSADALGDHSFINTIIFPNLKRILQLSIIENAILEQLSAEDLHNATVKINENKLISALDDIANFLHKASGYFSEGLTNNSVFNEKYRPHVLQLLAAAEKGSPELEKRSLAIRTTYHLFDN